MEDELARPAPDLGARQRLLDRLSRFGGRRAAREGGRIDIGEVDVSTPDGPASAGEPSWWQLALTGSGAALLVIGGLWAWQSWSGRSDPPVDDLLPPLVASVADTDVAEPEAGEGADTAPLRSAAGRDEVRGASTRDVANQSATMVPTATPVEPTPEPVPLVVHVSGAVGAAGVVEVEPGSRVYEAVALAGGASLDADLARINLAAPVVDGERIHVPRVGEEDRPALVPTDRPVPSTGPPLGSGPAAEPTPLVVDLNRASSMELQALPGVGPATADAIVRTRDERGPFFTVDELVEVPGIGQATLEELRPYVWVQSS